MGAAQLVGMTVPYAVVLSQRRLELGAVAVANLTRFVLMVITIDGSADHVNHCFVVNV